MENYRNQVGIVISVHRANLLTSIRLARDKILFVQKKEKTLALF